MTARCELPGRRYHESFNLEHLGIRYTVGVGRYPDGRVGELFINSDKVGTAADVLARDAAVVLSIAFQHDISPVELGHAVTRDLDGNASGLIGKLLDILTSEESELRQAVGDLG